MFTVLAITDDTHLTVDTTTPTLSTCPTCVPLLWLHYNIVVPLIAGDFVKPIGNIQVQK